MENVYSAERLSKELTQDLFNMLFALVNPASICHDPEHPKLAQQFLMRQFHCDSMFDHHSIEFVPAEQRAQILLNYLLDESIDGLWCLRGGEGSADLLPWLHQQQTTLMKAKPKPIIGFSDNTALLNYFARYYQWPVIHGPGLLQLALEQIEATETVLPLLQQQTDVMLLTDLNPMNPTANRTEDIVASLVGGNLSLLNISINDIWQPQTHGKIVFIEEVGELSHKVIRQLKYLQRVGFFAQAKAVIFGDCVGEFVDDKAQSIQRALQWFAQQLSCPVFQSQQFGHGKKNQPLPLYGQVMIRSNQLIFTNRAQQ